MANDNSIKDNEIRSLLDEAAQAGDALQVYICRRALGEDFTLARLNDESCLSPAEAREVCGFSAATARNICAAAIASGNSH